MPAVRCQMSLLLKGCLEDSAQFSARKETGREINGRRDHKSKNALRLAIGHRRPKIEPE